MWLDVANPAPVQEGSHADRLMPSITILERSLNAAPLPRVAPRPQQVQKTVHQPRPLLRLLTPLHPKPPVFDSKKDLAPAEQCPYDKSLCVIAYSTGKKWTEIVTHLKLADIPSGLLVNFNVENLRLGIKRAIISRDGRFTEPAYSA